MRTRSVEDEKKSVRHLEKAIQMLGELQRGLVRSRRKWSKEACELLVMPRTASSGGSA